MHSHVSKISKFLGKNNHHCNSLFHVVSFLVEDVLSQSNLNKKVFEFCKQSKKNQSLIKSEPIYKSEQAIEKVIEQAVEKAVEEVVNEEQDEIPSKGTFMYYKQYWKDQMKALDPKTKQLKGRNLIVLTGKWAGSQGHFVRWNGTNTDVQFNGSSSIVHISNTQTISLI